MCEKAATSLRSAQGCCTLDNKSLQGFIWNRSEEEGLFDPTEHCECVDIKRNPLRAEV